MKLGTPLESEVLRSCRLMAEALGVLVWRNNSGTFTASHEGKGRCFRAGAGVGSSDLIGVLPGGRVVAIEVKRKGERPRPEQYNWLQRIKSQGGLAFWADDAATVREVIEWALRPDGHRVSVGINRTTGEQWIEIEERRR